MRIVCWNCNGEFFTQEKYKKISEYDADIYVISEINHPPSTDTECLNFMKNNVYLEPNESDEINGLNRGLAVIAKEGIKLEDNHWYSEYNEFLSVRVNDSFDVVGVWTHRNYVQRVEDYLKLHEEDFLKADNLVMCGDFNLDISLPCQKDKDTYVKLLRSYGYESIYHKTYNESFGKESVDTFFKPERVLHLDYVFTKPEIVTTFEMGDKKDYVPQWSKHIPLMVEINL